MFIQITINYREHLYTVTKPLAKYGFFFPFFFLLPKTKTVENGKELACSCFVFRAKTQQKFRI